jgi:hypothetical protein
MFCYFASPPLSLPAILVPMARENAPYLYGIEPPILEMAQELYDSAYAFSDETLFDTHFLLDDDSLGIINHIEPFSRWVFDTCALVVRNWYDSPPERSEMIELQDTIAERVHDKYRFINSTLSIEKDLNKPGDLGIKIVPNPFNKKVRIYFDSVESNIITISIYDLMGKRILWKRLPRKSNYLQWSPEGNASSGIYFVNIRTREGNSEQFKILNIE